MREKIELSCTLKELLIVSKIADIQYLLIYLIMFSIATLLSIGYQDIFYSTVPEWNNPYLLSNFAIAAAALIAIFLNIFHDRNISFYFVGGLLFFFATWAVIQSIILLGFNIDGGIIFRFHMNILISGLLFVRLVLLYFFRKWGV